MVDNLNCDFFQGTKLEGKGYGNLPECEVQSNLLEECTMDSIGPWNIQACGKPHKFQAFDVPIQDLKSRTQVKNPSQDFKPKNTSHNCCLLVCLFVCLLASFTNSMMENDSQKCHIRDVCSTEKNKIWLAQKKTSIKLYLFLFMPSEQKYVLPWELAPEDIHSTGTLSLTFL
jgi:hypothetical protein